MTPAPSKEEVLNLYYELFRFIPVNWNDKESIKQFKLASDKYSKMYSRLDHTDQGWISEQLDIQ